VLAGAALGTAVWLAAGPGGAADDDKAAWKPVIPEDAYKELLKRSAKLIADNVDSKEEGNQGRAEVEAVRVAAYTLSAKGGEADERAAVRTAALKIAATVRDKGNLADAKKLAAELPKLKGIVNVTKGVPDLHKQLKISDLMDLYRPVKKGGEGLPPTLQTTAAMKTTQNSIEDKLRYLAGKKLRPAVLAKEADELALFSYKIAADGALTATYASDQKKEQKLWRDTAEAVRDAAARLGEAAGKKDADGIFQAATALDNACTQCHNAFRKKS
jgi:cytochrome c556